MPASISIVAPFWLGMGVVFNMDKESYSHPINRFRDCKIRPPAGITTRETMYGILFEAIYSSVHLDSPNQLYPTQAELYFWRIANLILLGLLAVRLITIPISVVSSRPHSTNIADERG